MTTGSFNYTMAKALLDPIRYSMLDLAISWVLDLLMRASVGFFCLLVKFRNEL